MFVWLTLLLLLQRRAANGFNLDTDVPIVKTSSVTYDTYFGFSVTAHRLQQNGQTV